MKPHLFKGDWPATFEEGGAGLVGNRDTGVRYVDELCPSCGGPITTTGECRCSD